MENSMVTKEIFEELVKRVDKHENTLDQLKIQDTIFAVQQGKTDTKIDTLTKTVEEIKNIVTELAKQPAKRWDKLINAVIAGVVSLVLSGIITFALTKH